MAFAAQDLAGNTRHLNLVPSTTAAELFEPIAGRAWRAVPGNRVSTRVTASGYGQAWRVGRQRYGDAFDSRIKAAALGIAVNAGAYPVTEDAACLAAQYPSGRTALLNLVPAIASDLLLQALLGRAIGAGPTDCKTSVVTEIGRAHV